MADLCFSWLTTEAWAKLNLLETVEIIDSTTGLVQNVTRPVFVNFNFGQNKEAMPVTREVSREESLIHKNSIDQLFQNSTENTTNYLNLEIGNTEFNSISLSNFGSVYITPDELSATSLINGQQGQLLQTAPSSTQAMIEIAILKDRALNSESANKKEAFRRVNRGTENR